jgi:hypothetical protein
MTRRLRKALVGWIGRNSKFLKVWAGVIVLLSWAISNTLGERAKTLEKSIKEVRDERNSAPMYEMRERLRTSTIGGMLPRPPSIMMPKMRVTPPPSLPMVFDPSIAGLPLSMGNNAWRPTKKEMESNQVAMIMRNAYTQVLTAWRPPNFNVLSNFGGAPG